MAESIIKSFPELPNDSFIQNIKLSIVKKETLISQHTDAPASVLVLSGQISAFLDVLAAALVVHYQEPKLASQVNALNLEYVATFLLHVHTADDILNGVVYGN